MRNDPEIAACAKSGYVFEPGTALFSSAKWLAHEAGMAIREKELSEPTAAHMSRGYSVKVKTREGEWLVKFLGDSLEEVHVIAL